MQRGADANHACPQYENVSLAFRHRALSLNVTRSRSLPALKQLKLFIAATKPVIAASQNKQVSFQEIALARRPNSLATWYCRAADPVENEQRANLRRTLTYVGTS
jgi:hypothetical protein